MTIQTWNRRGFLGAAGAVSLLGMDTVCAAAEPPPETTRIRLNKIRSLCLAPVYVAEALLRAEGFTDVQYFGDGPTGIGGLPAAQALGAGAVDFSMNFAAPLAVAVDSGAPITILAGVHPGCFELFGTERIRTISDLKGKTIVSPGVNSAQHLFLASIATSIGLDAERDINWVTHPPEEAMRLFAEGRIDGLLAFPPDAQELRAKHVGHVVLNSAIDRPWSQYYCCLAVANREFAQKNPIATKRALRAIIKAGDICASDPDRGARAYLDLGFRTAPEYARQAMREIPYGRWRDFNPEDTLRFYALRLREARLIKSSPQQLIAQGTDWRFIDQIKRELKT
jgi:NitT/TauT family transport system substrate-binding protein